MKFKLSPINQRRWKTFFRQKRARVGLIGLGLLLFLSVPAEMWSSQAPILLMRKVDQGDGSRRVFFPSFFDYSAADFGITDSFIIDYKELIQRDAAENRGTIAVFPLNRWDPFVQSAEVLAGPTGEHWLGTDVLGRDVAARLLYGIRVSLTYGLLCWFFSYVIGVLIGSAQGYFAGRFDFVMERFKEIAEIIPFLSAVILINGLMKSQSLWVSIFIVVVLSWIGISSQIRAQFLSLRQREFCEAARAMGAGHLRIIFLQLLPNALTPILTLTPFAISAGISVLAILDYLGYGLNPPTPSLGELLAQGRSKIEIAPWLLLAPTGALVAMLISINLIGEALREAFDPRKS